MGRKKCGRPMVAPTFTVGTAIKFVGAGIARPLLSFRHSSRRTVALSTQRQNPSAGRKRHKFQLREGGRQLVCHEVNFVLVPRCACLRLARFQLRTGAERHIADQDLAVLLQQRQQPVEKQHLLGVRQVVQRIGREDKIIALRAERLHQSLFEKSCP